MTTTPLQTPISRLKRGFSSFASSGATNTGSHLHDRHSSSFAPVSMSWTRTWVLIYVFLGLGALLTRLWNLGYPTDKGTPVFDEKHYVPQSWNVAESWSNLFTPGIEDNPAYGLVVHPPFAKQMEALGMLLFGYTPWGWRFIGALCSVFIILLIASIARRLTGSEFIGLAAGLMAICDGVLFVTGRSAMLDTFQVVFIVLSTYCLLRDHQEMEGRFFRVHSENRMEDHPWGPRMGFRWWRFGAGVALGCALSVKWSGLYYMAFFGIGILIMDMWRRKRWGVTQPIRGALVRDSFLSFSSLVLVPIVLYLWNWRPWFASTTSVYRHATDYNNEVSDLGLGFLPDTLQNWLYYHLSVLEFHASLTNSNGHHHPWESKPWSWLASTRSLLYYSENNSEEHIRSVIVLLGTPIIWWLTVPMLLWGLWCLFIHKDMRWVLPIVAYMAGFLPWVLNSDRQMYFFYAAALAPFLIIGICLILAQILQWNPSVGSIVVPAYLAIVVFMFLFFLPIFSALPISDYEWEMRMWLPSWK